MHGLIVCIVWVSTAMRIENIVLITALLNGALSSETAAEQQCPFLQDFNWTQQCVCTHAATYRYECESQEIPVGFCMTYNESADSLHSGLCPYDPDFTGNMTLDETKNIVLKLSLIQTIHDLNGAMCGHLNREGLLCGKCKPNYGTALYSKTLQCMPCRKNKVWVWLLYLILEMVPLTGLYFAIIIFNIRATSPPFTAFLFHHQFLSFLNTISLYSVTIGYRANQTLLKLTMTVLDIWNMDALRHLVPLFCVSDSLSNFQVHVIRLVSALYPLILVVASYLLIELHARNYKVTVVLWKPFHRCFAQLRRKWDPKSSNITAFSTFTMLTVFKLWFMLLTLFQTNKVSSSSNTDHLKVSYIDPYMHYGGSGYTIPLMLIIVMIIITPTAILCLHPTKCYRKCCFSRKFQLLNFFVHTFQGYYKDGTNGSRDYRAVSSIVLILRVIPGIVFYPHTSKFGTTAHTLSIVMVYILIIISLFYAIVQPCKEKHMNDLESILYAFTALSFLCITNANLSPRSNGTNLRSVFANLFLVIQLLPSLVLLIKVLQKIAVKIQTRYFPKKWECLLKHESSTDSLPDRLSHPNSYTPLI
jgi:hypothetical protein